MKQGIEFERTWTGQPRDHTRGNIVFVNSLATTWAMWDALVAALPGGWQVLRYDQRDRDSERGKSPFDLDDLVADLIEVQNRAGVERAHVVGVSLGGMVALRAAAVHPERFVSLTAMCCAARFPRDVWIERAGAVRRGEFESLIPGILNRWFTPPFQAQYPGVIDDYRAMLASTDTTGYAHASDLLAESDVRGDLHRIDVPALIVAGEADPANSPADLHAIATRIPHARLELLPEVAHLAPVAAPMHLARLIAHHALEARDAVAADENASKDDRPRGKAG